MSEPPVPQPAADLPPATKPATRRTRASAPQPPAAPATGVPVPPAPPAARRAPAKKAPAKKAPAKKAPAKKAPAKKAPLTTADVATAPVSHSPVTLCIDVGGTGIKGTAVGADGEMLADRVKITTSYPLRPTDLVDTIAEIARRSPAATRVSIGFPGMVRSGRVLSAPHFVTKDGPGTTVRPELVAAWDGFDLSTAVDERLSLPTRLANDADTQGLAAVHGHGLELVITLGTGIGTALFLDGELQTHLELSHHPLTKGKTYNEYVGNAAYEKVGPKKWTKRVDATVTVLKALTFYDHLFIGGGNAQNLGKGFRHEATIVPNTDGIVGGLKLWSLHRVP